jgi:hypothetical protein
MRLWIFGDSLSLPYHLEQESSGWPAIVANTLDCEIVNFAKPAADNFYIYSSYQHALPNINNNDIVVVGWSHPSRKSFVFDETNPLHIIALNDSYVYETNIKFIRSKNHLNDTTSKWEKLSPVAMNKPFYDKWFLDYYSVAEQQTNLFAYYTSVSATCPGQYIPFFFSKESIIGLDVMNHAGTMLEFILSNNCCISLHDAHPNAHGHRLWADIILTHINQTRKKSVFPVVELVDRYTIAKLKFAKTNNNLEEVEFYNNQLKCYNLNSVNNLIDELYQIHSSIWTLEAELKSGRESNLDLNEIGKRAIEIRNWNNRRVSLKNQIAEIFNCPVREIKKDHLSQ